VNDPDEWFVKAREIDELSGANVWKDIRESDAYDYEMVENRTLEIKALVREANYSELTYLLRSGLERNFGGILNSQLYKTALVGTKVIIEEYVKEVENALNFLYNAPDSAFPLQDKFSFFMEVRQRFGRTALLASGGAAFGMFHVGILRAATLLDIVPRVVSGSSAGSIIAAGMASTLKEHYAKFDVPANYQLKAFSKGIPNELWENFKRLLSEGSFMDVHHLVRCMKDNLDDLTFKEVYEKTGVMLNITIGATAQHEMPRLLNYLTAPDVVIWPAVAASCAFPYLFEPIPLIQRRKNGEHVTFHEPASKWRDGSLEHDLPMRRLAEMFNVNFHIVSQVNPHVIPIYHLGRIRIVRLFLNLIGLELKHRLLQLAYLGFVPKLLESIATQDYTGDITVVPQVAWWQWFRVVSNPTDDFMNESMLRGRQAFYQKSARILIGYRVERLLENRIQDLCERMNVPYAKAESSKQRSEPLPSSSKLTKQTSTLTLDGVASLHLSSVHLPRLMASESVTN